jgi:hypothetical protein
VSLVSPPSHKFVRRRFVVIECRGFGNLQLYDVDMAFHEDRLADS